MYPLCSKFPYEKQCQKQAFLLVITIITMSRVFLFSDFREKNIHTQNLTTSMLKKKKCFAFDL